MGFRNLAKVILRRSITAAPSWPPHRKAEGLPILGWFPEGLLGRRLGLRVGRKALALALKGLPRETFPTA